MKKRLLSVTGLTMVVLLNGCGEKMPEDVAIEFATSMANANMDKANSLASKEMKQKLIGVNDKCNYPLQEVLEDEAKSILKKTYRTTNRGNVENMLMQSKINKIRSEIFEKTAVLKAKITKDVIDKYGSLDKIKSVKMQNIKNKMRTTLSSAIEPDIGKIFKLLNIDSKNEEDIKNIVSRFMIAHTKLTYDSISKVGGITITILDSKNIPVTKECISEYTVFGMIDDINTLEIIKNSPDSSTVRLEVINKDENSKKITMRMEKIREEWKVSSVN